MIKKYNLSTIHVDYRCNSFLLTLLQGFCMHEISFIQIFLIYIVEKSVDMCYIVYWRSEVVDNDLFTCHTKTGPTLQKKRFVLNSSRKTLQNLPYFVYKKTHQVFPFFILCNFEFTIYECPSQPCFYTSKCIRR